MSRYFASWMTFIHMGGYANYIWPAYAIVLVVLIAKIVLANRSLKRTKSKIRMKYANHS